MTAKLNTADGSPMMALGSTALHLQIAEFKFTHNFIICDQLPETELIFGINIQKKFSLSYAWDKEKNCYIQQIGKFLVYTHCQYSHSNNRYSQVNSQDTTQTQWCGPQSRSVDQLSQHIWHISLQMTVLPKERTQTLT